MLTEKQKSLFKMLEINEIMEKDLRKFHRSIKEMGAPKDFTTWLTNCLHNKWKQENERARGYTYVGD